MPRGTIHFQDCLSSSLRRDSRFKICCASREKAWPAQGPGMDGLINPAPVVHQRKDTHRNKARQGVPCRLSTAPYPADHSSKTYIFVHAQVRSSPDESQRDAIDALEIFEVNHFTTPLRTCIGVDFCRWCNALHHVLCASSESPISISSKFADITPASSEAGFCQTWMQMQCYEKP